MTRLLRRPAAVLLAAAAVAAVPATVALAAGPPRGKYECYQYDAYVGYSYSGGFVLKAHGVYSAISGGKGRYSVKGRKVTFKTGPYKDFTGKTRRDNKHNWIIDLTLKSDHSVVENCSHVKK